MNNIIARDPVIKLNTMMYRIIGLVIALFACGSSLMTKQVPGVVRIGIAAVLIIFLVCVAFRWHIPTSDARFLFLVLMMLLFMYVGSAWSLSESLHFAVGLVLCLFSIRRGDWINHALNFMEFFYLIYAAATIFMFLNPEVYSSFVSSVYPLYKDSLMYMYKSGCMAGLTHHFSSNAMVLSVGIILSCSRFFNFLQVNPVSARKEKIHKYLRLLLVFIFVIALLLTGKRSHVLFVAAAVLVLYYLSNYNRSTRKRITKIFFFIIGSVVVMGLVFLIVPALSVFIQRFETLLEQGDIANGRTNLWNLAWDAFKQSPITGIGWSQYAASLSSTLHMKREMNHVHNVYLQLLCETGIIGFTVYMTWFISILWLSIKSYRRINFYKTSEFEAANFHLKFAIGYQVFFLLYCMTGNPLYTEEMFIPYFICCSIALYYNRRLKVYLVEKRLEEERLKEKKLFEQDLNMPKWIRWL